MENLKKYKSVIGKSQSLFTILVYDSTLDEILAKLHSHLKKIQTIHSAYKKKVINDRLYEFICYLKDTKESSLNSIYLVGNKIENIKLSKNEQSVLKEYNVAKYTFMYDSCFHIDYLIDIFTNFTFFDVIVLEKKSAEHYLLNENKRKIIKQFSCSKESDLTNYITENITGKCFVHGQNMILKNLSFCDHIFVYKKLVDSDIFDIFAKEEMKIKHIDLQKCFDMISNEKQVHLVIYGKLGKDIKEAIEQYRIKKLFVHQKVLNKLKDMISEEYFNFDLVEISSLENKDIGQILMDQYDGAIGIAYY